MGELKKKRNTFANVEAMLERRGVVGLKQLFKTGHFLEK